LFSNQTFNPSVDTRGSLSTLSPLLFYKNHINLSANHAQPSPHCRNEISGKHFLPLSFPFVSLSLSLSLSPPSGPLCHVLSHSFFFLSLIRRSLSPSICFSFSFLSLSLQTQIQEARPSLSISLVCMRFSPKLWFFLLSCCNSEIGE